MQGISLADFSVDAAIERERANGVEFGPYHRQWLNERSPDKVKRLLRLAHEKPWLVATQGGFLGTDGNIFPGGGTAAINTTTTETNLWNPGLAPMKIPAGTMVPGRSWRVEFGGVMGTTATPTIIGSQRCGTNNAAPPTGTLLGASPTVTLGTITAPQAFMGWAVMGCRSVASAAASQATVTGNGIIFFPAAAAATVTPHALIGGVTIPTTIDQTIDQGIGVSVTWGASSASNTITCQWFGPIVSVG